MRALLLTGLLAAGCYAAEFADAIDADAGAPLESAALADGWQCETDDQCDWFQRKFRRPMP